MADMDYGMSMAQPPPQGAPPPGAPDDPSSLASMSHPLVQMGSQALSSGKVHIDDALKVAKALGLVSPKKKAADVLGMSDGSMFGAQGGAPSGQPPQGPSPVAQAFQKALIPGSGPKKQQEKISNTHSNATPDDVSAENLRMQADPAYQDIMQGNDALGKQAPELLSMQQKGGWLQPLAALADFEAGRDGSKGTAQSGIQGQVGASPAQMSQTILKYQDEMQKRKEDLYKAQQAALSKYAANQGKTTTVIGDVNGVGSNMLKRTIATQASAASKQFDSDKLLNGLEGGFNSFDKFQGLMDGKTPIDSSKYNIMQEDLTRAMASAGAGGGNVADARVVRDQISNVFAKWNEIETKVVKDGKIPDMRQQAPALFTQLQSFKDQLRQDFENQYSQRVDQLKHNYDQTSMVTGAPEIAQAAYDKADRLLKARITGGKSLPNAQIPGAPAPSAKKPKDPSQMSLEELKAELNGGR